MRYLAFILAAITSAELQAFQLAPRLVVNITVDQLRSDYIEAFYPMYSDGGIKRIMHDGMVYENVGYPFAPVDRASATATLSTGTTPFYHGIVSSQWMDRQTLQPVSCVDDNKHINSPQRLKTSTVGDELKIATDGQAIVYAFAANKEAAILAAGHAADGAFWKSNRGPWLGSTYYASIPQWLQNYNKDHHNTKPSRNTNDDNKDVIEASLAAVEAAGMGKDDISDLLYISLAANNPHGVPITNWQTDMGSIYVQLDKCIQRLIDGIQKQVSLDQVLFVLTSTGYTEERPTDLAKYRIPTGTFYINRTANLLNIYLGAIYGQGRYVEQTFSNQIYLNHKLIEQKRIAMSDILKRSQEFLVQLSGVADVYTSTRLLAGNPDIIKIRNDYNPTLSGDIIIQVTPGWKLLNENTQETYTSRAGFMPFPIVFMGLNIKPQRITSPVEVDHIAPTIAKAIRIRAPNACNASPLF